MEAKERQRKPWLGNRGLQQIGRQRKGTDGKAAQDMTRERRARRVEVAHEQIEQIAPFCFFWFGDQVYTHLVDLGALLGMTGCFSHCNGTLGAFSQTVTSNGSSSMAISVPNNPALLRFELSVQVTSASVQTNTGWSASNGLIGRVGN